MFFVTSFLLGDAPCCPPPLPPSLPLSAARLGTVLDIDSGSAICRAVVIQRGAARSAARFCPAFSEPSSGTGVHSTDRGVTHRVNVSRRFSPRVASKAAKEVPQLRRIGFASPAALPPRVRDYTPSKLNGMCLRKLPLHRVGLRKKEVSQSCCLRFLVQNRVFHVYVYFCGLSVQQSMRVHDFSLPTFPSLVRISDRARFANDRV